MNTLSYKTISANKETVKKEWVVIDAKDQIVGRLCSKVAKLLRGKYKPNFTPHVDCGDNVIIINAEKVEVTGKKRKEKIYKRHTGYPGGLREITFEKLQAKKPEEIIRHAVKGMLPDGKTGASAHCTETGNLGILGKGGIDNGKDAISRNRQKKKFSC